MTGIGDSLRTARRQQGRSLADAASATRVRESYLAALEEEEFASLGGDVYVKGFVRSYARFLGLDPEPLVEAYRRDYERGEEGAPVPVPGSQPLPGEPREGLRPLAVAAALALALVAVFLLVNRTGGEGSLAVSAPAPVDSPAEAESPPAEEPEPISSQPVVEVPTPTFDPNAPAVEPTEMEVAGEELVVRLLVSGPESWLRVVVDGTTKREGQASGGTDVTYRSRESVEVRVGDAGAVRLWVNGEEQELGGSGEAVSRRYVVAS
jgi:cytoskeleton protein RodZ